MKILSKVLGLYSNCSQRTGNVVKKVCGKTKFTDKVFNGYLRTNANIKNRFKIGQRANKIYGNNKKVTNIFSGLNSVRKEVGYFPMITAATTSVVGNYMFPCFIPYSGIGLVGGIALKTGAKNLIKYIC